LLQSSQAQVAQTSTCNFLTEALPFLPQPYRWRTTAFTTALCDSLCDSRGATDEIVESFHSVLRIPTLLPLVPCLLCCCTSGIHLRSQCLPRLFKRPNTYIIDTPDCIFRWAAQAVFHVMYWYPARLLFEFHVSHPMRMLNPVQCRCRRAVSLLSSNISTHNVIPCT
jgi:hypothetical protein